MEKKSCGKLLVLFLMFILLLGAPASTVNAQWWWSSSSSSGGAVVDTQKPVITSFTAPEVVNSRIIPITSFKASDNVRVTGYCLYTVASECEFTSRPPTYYSVPTPSNGIVVIFAKVRDAAGNISDFMTARVEGVPVASAPDLVVTRVIHPALTVTPENHTILVTDTITNQGKRTAGTTRTKYSLYYFYESRQANGMYTRQTQEIPLTGNRSISSLWPGKSSTGTMLLTLPTSLSPGMQRNFQIRVYADCDNAVVESNESNNDTRSGTQTITYPTLQQ